MKKILVATDGSPAARQAVEMGIDLGAEQDARVTFLRVFPTDWTRDPDGPRSAGRTAAGR